MENKYLKYKSKYLNEKNMYGGAVDFTKINENNNIMMEAINENNNIMMEAIKKVNIAKQKSIEANKRLVETKQKSIEANKRLVETKQRLKANLLKAVEQNGLALKFASKELRDDKEIVLKAVNQNGLALEFATEKLQNVTSIVLKAVQNNPFAIQFASYKNKINPDIIHAALVKLLFSSYNDKDQEDFINLYDGYIIQKPMLKMADMIMEENGMTFGYNITAEQDKASNISLKEAKETNTLKYIK